MSTNEKISTPLAKASDETTAGSAATDLTDDDFVEEEYVPGEADGGMSSTGAADQLSTDSFGSASNCPLKSAAQASNSAGCCSPLAAPSAGPYRCTSTRGRRWTRAWPSCCGKSARSGSAAATVAD